MCRLRRDLQFKTFHGKFTQAICRSGFTTFGLLIEKKKQRIQNTFNENKTSEHLN